MTPSAISMGAKPILTAAALAATLTLAAGAASATEWRGGGHLSGFQGCAGAGWTAGVVQFIHARYRPSGMPDNGNFTRLSFIHTAGAENYSTPRGRFRRAFRPVRGVGVWSGGWEFQNGPQVRVTSQEPQNIRPRTKVIRLQGEIRGFTDERGCRVDFDVTLHRR